MSKAIRLALLSLLLTPLSLAGSTCPVTPITGTVDWDAIAVTFRNTGKLPVRRLEFNCTLFHAPGSKAQRADCREGNANFFPGMQYTVRYAYPGGMPRRIALSVKSVTLADGRLWKPSRNEPCRHLTIYPAKTKK